MVEDGLQAILAGALLYYSASIDMSGLFAALSFAVSVFSIFYTLALSHYLCIEKRFRKVHSSDTSLPSVNNAQVIDKQPKHDSVVMNIAYEV